MTECKPILNHCSTIFSNNLFIAFCSFNRNRLRQKPILSAETLNDRAHLLRLWSNYRNKRATSDFYMIDRLYRAQDNALQELKMASPKLYEEAIKVFCSFRVEPLFYFEF